MDDNTPMIVNLAATLDYGSKSPLQLIDDSTCYFLPSDKYKENTPKFKGRILAPLFVYSCKQAGFSLVMKGWGKKRFVLGSFASKLEHLLPRRHLVKMKLPPAIQML
jgi:hypothetical protein